LPRGTKRVALNLLIREGRGKNAILGQHLRGLGWLNLARLQLGIKKRALRSQQSELQRDQLPFERHVRLRDVLGVETPALDIRAVERVSRARQRNTVLDHRIEL